MSTSSLVLLCRDLADASIINDKTSPPPTRSTFSDEATPDTVLFTAEHRWNKKQEGYETVLRKEGKKIGTVSLASLVLGTASSVTVEEFYKYPHCFSSEKLFKLGDDGPWAYWKAGGEDGMVKLVEHKTKRIIATVVPIPREPYMSDEDFAAAPSSRLTIHLSLLAGSSSTLSSPAASPIESPKSTASSFSSAYTPSTVSSTPGSSALATRASSPALSGGRWKGKEVAEGERQVVPEKGKSMDSQTRSSVPSRRKSGPRRAFSCPLPSFTTLASLLHQGEKPSASAAAGAGEGEEKKGGVDFGGVDALGVVLLTLLHEDYVRAERRRKEDERNREERAMEWDAW